MESINLKDVTFTKGFWDGYRRLIHEVVIPYQWDALNDNVKDADPSCAIRNFKVAAGLETGKFYGFVFQDSDLYKWLETVGYSLLTYPDPSLEEKADQVIDLMEKAQQPDGYLDTFYIINGLENRFSNLHDCHELYCLGHMIEAAVAYYNGTRKRKLLDVACRFADLVDRMFSPDTDNKNGYPGHQELELALVKLYDLTGNERYIKLASLFIDRRGQAPHYFTEEWENRGRTSHWAAGITKAPDPSYNQSHLPVRQQDKAVGHSVRAVYMYTGMADLAKRMADSQLLASCRLLWDNITGKQMYITGGIGQTHNGEAFTFDYDLPNDTVYSETCAAIGLVFFAKRMLDMDANSKYADIMEKALYNSIISGIETNGKSFFYVNPLEVWPEASEKNPDKHHIKPVRQKWFGCACCPPNLARLIMSLGEYYYSQDNSNSTIYTHLYGSNEAVFSLDGKKVMLKQETNYPNDGAVTIDVTGSDAQFTIALRIPSWCRTPQIKVDDEIINCEKHDNGYVMLNKTWRENKIEIDFPMPVEVMRANVNVRADAGKVALQKGPIVYCLEEADNGANIPALSLLSDNSFREIYDESSRAVLIKARGMRDVSCNDSLYFATAKEKVETELSFTPYYLWGNRSAGEMSVWVRGE